MIVESSRRVNAERALMGFYKCANGFAILSPENPMGKPLSREENNKRFNEFKFDLKNLGATYYKLKGMYGGHQENSCFIYGLTKDVIVDLSKKYNQESFIWCISMVDIDKRKLGIKFEYYEIDRDTNEYPKYPSEDKISTTWRPAKSFQYNPEDGTITSDDYGFSCITRGTKRIDGDGKVSFANPKHFTILMKYFGNLDS